MQGFQPDSREAEVVVDADGPDGAQVSDAVLVRQQVFVVDGHLKVAVGAENLYLQQNKRSATSRADGPARETTPDLKRLTRGEGEGLQLSLLRPPLLVDEAVPDDRLAAAVIEARVEVEGHVTTVGGHVHGDPDTQEQPSARPHTHAAGSSADAFLLTCWRWR